MQENQIRISDNNGHGWYWEFIHKGVVLRGLAPTHKEAVIESALTLKASSAEPTVKPRQS